MKPATRHRARLGQRHAGAAIAAVLFALLAAPLAGSASGGVSPAADCGGGWAVVPSSDAVKDPRGLAVVASDDVWVVGDTSVPKAGLRPSAEHWDGSAWTLVSVPYSGLGENALSAVSAVSSGDVWAVGYWQPEKKVSPDFRTLVEHWDGSTWQVVPSPNVPSSHSNTLTGVAALSGSDVWAVGYSFDAGGVRKTLIEHYDGTSWSIVDSPSPGGSSDALLAVAGGSSDDVWAVGYSSAGLGYGALLLHYDGVAWAQVAGATDPSGAEDVLAGVAAVSGDDVWAFGYHVVGSQYRTLVQHWDGSSWALSPSPNGPDGVVTVLRAGSAVSGDVWAVGFDYHISAGGYTEYTAHFDGVSWTSVAGAMSSGKRKSEMYAVAHVPGTDQVWASARPAHVERICTSSVTERPRTERTGRSKGRPSRAVSDRGGPPIGGIAHGLPPAAAVSTVAIPHAADVAHRAGIFANTRTHGAVVGDFNGDGRPDIFLNRHVNLAKLFLNDGDGSFTLTDFGTFPSRDRHGCDAADVDGDGRLDLFCNTGADRGTEAKRDELWIQRPDGDFADRAAEYGILQPFDRGRISAFIDADGDGRPDVFAANFPDRADGMPSSNRLFVNQGGTSYRLAPEFGLDRELTGESLSVGDYDNDGYDDLLLCGIGGIHLFHNDAGGGFSEVTNAVGLDHRALAAEFVDFDRDGRLDVAEVNRSRLRIDLQRTGRFAAGPSATGLVAGFTLTVGDVNGDGWPDVYVQQAGEGADPNVADVVFLNDGAGSGFAGTPVMVPAPPEKGAADGVVPIDFNDDGYTDFVVTNGNSTKAGSVQLIEFTP